MNMILIEFIIKEWIKKKKKEVGNNKCATGIIAIVTVWHLFSLVFEEYTWRSYFDSFLFAQHVWCYPCSNKINPSADCHHWEGGQLLIQALDYTKWVTLPITHSKSSFQGALAMMDIQLERNMYLDLRITHQ